MSIPALIPVAPVRVMLIAQPLVSWGLERMLQTEPKRFQLVGVASSVAEAMLNMGQFKPSVVLLDQDGEDGTEALAHLRAQGSVKVLAITASTTVEAQDAIVLAGAFGVVNTRQSPATLFKALEKVAAGEMWLDRAATSRLLQEMARRHGGERGHFLGPSDNDRIAKLTPRERQAIRVLCDDTTPEGGSVANVLNISENTLRNHLTSIYRKLGVKSRVSLRDFAVRNGLTG